MKQNPSSLGRVPIRPHARIAAIALTMVATASVALAQSPATPEDHADCRNGAAMMLARQWELAADHLKVCAVIPGQTPYTVAKSRLDRFQALEQLGKRPEAEAELVALTSKPISDYPLFTRETSNLSIGAATKRSVGFTQPRLLAVLSSYRLAAEDTTAAVAIAERAMRATPRDPASEVDISTAYVTRAKARFLKQDQTGAISDILAAYMRGASDPWIVGQVNGFPDEAKILLADRQKIMMEQAQAYAQVTSTMGLLSTPADTREEIIAKAESTVPFIEAEEARLAGPRKWDTQP